MLLPPLASICHKLDMITVLLSFCQFGLFFVFFFFFFFFPFLYSCWPRSVNHKQSVSQITTVWKKKYNNNSTNKIKEAKKRRLKKIITSEHEQQLHIIIKVHTEIDCFSIFSFFFFRSVETMCPKILVTFVLRQTL